MKKDNSKNMQKISEVLTSLDKTKVDMKGLVVDLKH